MYILYWQYSICIDSHLLNCGEQVTSMGTKRWGAGVAVMDHRLYVIGFLPQDSP